jgi:hypothetical protein
MREPYIKHGVIVNHTKEINDASLSWL